MADCWAVLTPNGSRLVSPDEAKGRKDAYPLFTRAALASAPRVPLTDERIDALIRDISRAVENRITDPGLPMHGDWPVFYRAKVRAALALAQRVPRVPQGLEPLGPALVDSIANDGCRNAAGGIYATRVQQFALEVQRAFAQQNGMQLSAAPQPEGGAS
jgi:hypothetical protein